jgi:AAA family ATP:ADP antiporter
MIGSHKLTLRSFGEWLRPPVDVAMAMLCFAMITAEYVGGKAARDALYLAHMDVTTLPAMVIATSVASILFVTLSGRISARIAPSKFVPTLFVAGAALLILEWILTYQAPQLAAVVVYLQISGLGPLLGSSFWVIASDCFDPRTAKRRFGQIQAAGTLGGLIGGGIAYEVAAIFDIRAMLPVLAVLNLGCAYTVVRLAASAPRSQMPTRRADSGGTLAPGTARTGLRVLAGAPYLQMLAVLVLLGTTSAGLLDYVFKAEAKSVVSGDGLLRFFSIYYSASSLITFLLQTSASRYALERLGLALTAAAPALAVIGGSVASLVAPGIRSLTLARGGENVLRGSFFRAGYELFYTPIPSVEKRAVKPIIDVGFDRLGDAVGGGAVQLVLLLLPARQRLAILSLAIVSSLAALALTTRLRRGYIKTLERSLIDKALEIDLADVEDLTTRTAMQRTLRTIQVRVPRPRPSAPVATTAAAPEREDPELQDIRRLRSRDRDQVLHVLRRDVGLAPALVPHVIPLLSWDAAANEAIFALRKVAEEHVGELIDALIDPNQDFAVRRRLARAFSVCVSQRAADGMVLGLDDLRFEVRFQCGRSLAAIFDKNPMLRIDREQILAVVAREAAVGKMVWESHRLLDALESGDAPPFVDEFVRDRAGQSLAHVFTLLALVLPREPLMIAYRGLHTDDPHLKGTALEYLEAVLPPLIRDRLWPFLEDRKRRTPPARQREEILADLLRSHESIMINLEELRRRAAAEVGAPTKAGSRESDI